MLRNVFLLALASSVLLVGCGSEGAKAEQNAAAKTTVPADKMSEDQVQLNDK